MIKELLNGINGKLLFFAINNTCNCRCKMCSIWKMKEKSAVKYKDAKAALEGFYGRGFRLLQLTGGEPLMNPDFFRILKFAKGLGFMVSFPTNGTLVNENTAEKIADCGADFAGVSFHHDSPEIFEKISGHKNILESSMEAIRLLKLEKVPTAALCTIMRGNCGRLEEIVKYLDSRRISVSFCTPMVIRKTSFMIGSRHAEFSSSELKEIVSGIISLKKSHKNIINNPEFLKLLMDFLSGRESAFKCLGGEKIFYLDWNLKVFPCMTKGEGIPVKEFFSVRDAGGKGKCEGCIMQCFREPSIFLGPKAKAAGAFVSDIPSYMYLLGNMHYNPLQNPLKR